mmetsp:Transcript_16190/g.37186  ORF Transcript_16190/g.37186 Transcript_16190/m.37186 type:complete len:203 (+) Transcript_16190:399-1007(+)
MTTTTTTKSFMSILWVVFQTTRHRWRFPTFCCKHCHWLLLLHRPEQDCNWTRALYRIGMTTVMVVLWDVVWDSICIPRKYSWPRFVILVPPWNCDRRDCGVVRRKVDDCRWLLLLVGMSSRLNRLPFRFKKTFRRCCPCPMIFCCNVAARHRRWKMRRNSVVNCATPFSFCSSSPDEKANPCLHLRRRHVVTNELEIPMNGN